MGNRFMTTQSTVATWGIPVSVTLAAMAALAPPIACSMGAPIVELASSHVPMPLSPALLDVFRKAASAVQTCKVK